MPWGYITSFSLVQSGIIFTISILLWYVWEKDWKERRIPNVAIIIIGILGILWHISLWYIPIPVDHILQYIFILIIGYFLSLYSKIGSWDVKLALVLSIFLLGDIWPLIMIGNIASITLVFLAGYICGRFFVIWISKHIWARIIEDLRAQWSWYLSLRWRTSDEKIQRKEILWDIWFVFYTMLMSIVVRYIATTFLIPAFPSLSILMSGTGTIIIFISVSWGLRWLYRRWYGETTSFINTVLLTLLIAWSYQHGYMSSFIDSLYSTLLFLLTVGLIWYIVWKCYTRSLEYIGESSHIHTFPYSIFIGIGFFVTLVSHIHLAGIVIGWLRISL